MATAQQRPPSRTEPVEVAGVDISPRLYNSDLAPTKIQGRSWGAYNVFTLWGNDVHSLGNYAFAMGLFALGMSVWDILIAFAVASGMLFVLLNLSGRMGSRTGVPFPVMSRIAFGIRGSKLPAAVRGAAAIAWFGIQTYLASQVLRTLVTALWPGAADYDKNSILGLSTLGWIAFLFLWAVQVLIVSYGMQAIRRYMALAAPTVLVTVLALAVWMFVKADGSIALDNGTPFQGGTQWLHIFEAAALWVVVYGTFVLNFCDFTRSAKSNRAISRGNLIGIPVNMLFFAAIAVVLSGAQFRIDGQVITSPTQVVQDIPSTILLALACLALLMLTVAVNLLANFVAPVYMLVNMFPQRLTFRSAGVVSAVIGLVILPWNLYDSPVAVTYFLGGLGALLGPVFGIVMADYWLLRKAQIHVPHLYTEHPEATYHYRRGVNMKAVGVFVPAAVISVIIALVPAFAGIAGFSWFIGAGIAAALYWAVNDRKQTFEHVDGENIAVAAE